MEGHSSRYAVALWSSLRSYRLIALCAVSLLLIPQSLAQQPEYASVSYVPGNWKEVQLDGVTYRYSDNPNAAAMFEVNADLHQTFTVSAGASVWSTSSRQPVNLLMDDEFADNINPGQPFTYTIPNTRRGVQGFTIKVKPGMQSSATLYVSPVTLGPLLQATNTQTQLPTTPTTNTQIISTISNGLSSNLVSSSSTPSSNLSITSTVTTTSDTTTLLGPVTDLPTGLGSPPPNTNIYSSISNASLTSDGSNSSGPSSSTIVGAVFGILIGITLCVFAALFYRRRRRRNRVAPSTAFMNYRSTTEQPPAYPFSRRTFFRRSIAGFGTGDSKTASPHPFAPGMGGLGYGATAGAGGRRLMTLDEKSAEGGESILTASAIAPSYDDPQRLVVPAPSHGGMGMGEGVIGATALGVAVAGVYAPGSAAGGLGMDGVARTLTPPPSTTSDKFASTPSLMDQNPYDGIAMTEPVPELPSNPFGTPPSDDDMAGRGVWDRV